MFVAWQRFLAKIANPLDDRAGSVSVPHNVVERLPRLVHVRRLSAEPTQPRLGVQDRSSDRLVHFMGDRGRKLPHRRDAVRVRQLHLRLA